MLDNLFENACIINKAQAYEILVPAYKDLQELNRRLVEALEEAGPNDKAKELIQKAKLLNYAE